RGTALLWGVACDAFLHVLAGSRQRTQQEPRCPDGIVGCNSERGLIGTLRQAQQRFANLSHRVQLELSRIKSVQTIQDWSEFLGLADLGTTLARLGVDMLHFGCPVPFGDLQSRPKGDVQDQGVLGMFRRRWQSREQLDPSGEVADGFQMGRALDGPLASALPVDNSLCAEARLG